MDDFPWIYVAMIFIAFISWLRTRLKDAAERRREIAESRRDKSDRSAPLAKNSSPYHDSPLESTRPANRRAEAAESFERMVERMVGIEPEPVEKHESISSPPPLPASRKSGSGNKPVPGELVESAGEFEVQEPELRVPKKSLYESNRGKRSHSASQFIRTLRHKESIRNAIILKEVLEKPKGLD